MYTDSQSSMQSIEYNKENRPILNKIYDILAELQAQDKKIMLCKASAYMGIIWNEKTDKAAKQAIEMPEIITTRLP